MNDMLKDSLYRIVFSYGNYDVYIYNLLTLAVVCLVGLVLGILCKRFLLVRFLEGEVQLPSKERIRARRWFWSFFWSLLLLGVLFSLELDAQLFSFGGFDLNVTSIVKGLAVFEFVRVIDWFVIRVFLGRFVEYRKQTSKDNEHQLIDKEATAIYKSSQYALYFVLIIFLLKQFGINFALFSIDAGNGFSSDIRISHFLCAILVFILLRIIIWITTTVLLQAYYQKSEVDVGGRFAINQLVKYVFYIIGIIIALRVVGINVSLLLGGAAALLVGIGLGLQQLFNDLISGVIILFDRTIEIDDVVEINGVVGRVRRIGIRASLVETRDNVSVVVPNSKFMSENVINWSHEDAKVRFFIKVGVAYGSDTALVKDLLIRAAKGHPQVLRSPEPFVRLCDFGSSSLDMELFFWSINTFRVENIKSDIRFEIDRLFREHNVIIPFPQIDVWERK